MKIIGLIIVVFGCVTINKYFGYSDEAMIIGTVVGAGSYILLNSR